MLAGCDRSLRNKEGKLDFPSGPADHGKFVESARRQTGVTVRPDQFVPIFTLSTGVYQAYKNPISLDFPKFESHSDNSFTNFQWVSPVTAPPAVLSDVVESTRKFLDVCGTKISEVVSKDKLCACAECQVGETGFSVSPPAAQRPPRR